MQTYSSILSLTSALDGGVGGQRHAPSALLPGKGIRYPLYSRLGGPHGPVWTGAENLAPTGVRFPDRLARRESLYWLRYPGPRCFRVAICNIHTYFVYNQIFVYNSMKQSPCYETNGYSVKKLAPLYGTRRFITVFTTAIPWRLSWQD